jgi:hypothetical protein
MSHKEYELFKKHIEYVLGVIEATSLVADGEGEKE